MWVKISKNNNYSINEKGEVRNDSNGAIKKPTKCTGNGYLMVDLYLGNKRQKFSVHRLLAEAFIPNEEDKPCIDHKDGNRENNSLSNLRWATYSENNSRFNTYGVRSEPIIVEKYSVDGKFLSSKRYEQISEVAEEFDCCISNVSQMLKKGTVGLRGKMRDHKFLYCKNM